MTKRGENGIELGTHTLVNPGYVLRRDWAFGEQCLLKPEGYGFGTRWRVRSGATVTEIVSIATLHYPCTVVHRSGSEDQRAVAGMRVYGGLKTVSAVKRSERSRRKEKERPEESRYSDSKEAY